MNIVTLRLPYVHVCSVCGKKSLSALLVIWKLKRLKDEFCLAVINNHSSTDLGLIKFGSVNNWLKEHKKYPQVPTKFTVGGTSVVTGFPSCLSAVFCSAYKRFWPF